MAQITITRKIKLLASAEYQPSYGNTVSTGRNTTAISDYKI